MDADLPEGGDPGVSRVLCRLDEIPDGEGRGFDLDRDTADGLAGGALQIFVVRQGDRVLGYANACPHLSTPLDWIENQFMSTDKSLILCATHGALFRIDDGHCVAGPCEGDSLKPLQISVHDGKVSLHGTTAG